MAKVRGLDGLGGAAMAALVAAVCAHGCGRHDGGGSGSPPASAGTPGAAGSVSAAGNAAQDCEDAADCDAVAASEGWICLAGRCVPCSSDRECRDEHYGPTATCSHGRCASPPGSNGGEGGTGSDGPRPGGGIDAGGSIAGGNPPTGGVDGGGAPGTGGAGGLTCADLECDAQHRTCYEASNGAFCDECEEDYVEVDGDCVRYTSCSELDCAAEHRNCVEDPNGRCTGCLPGSVEDDGICATPCVDGVLDPSTGDCRVCDCAGIAGSTGQAHAELTAEGDCICETLDGYFFDPTGSATIVPCDADGDGWVRISAKSALESSDPAVAANARCDLRRIDHIIFRPDAVRSEIQSDAWVPETYLWLSVEQTGPDGTIHLYETDRNDDDTLLAQEVNHYGSLGLILRAAHVNGFTKACHEGSADYNDNLVDDVREHQASEAGGSAADVLQLFVPFTYFLELYSGEYLESAAAGEPGGYVIEERAREGELGLRYSDDPVADGGDGSDYWKRCDRVEDTDWTAHARPAPGLDFAQYDAFMGHHSQFKCKVIVPDGAAGVGSARELQKVEQDELDQGVFAGEDTLGQTYQYRLNRCNLTGSQTSTSEIPNPVDPQFSCSASNQLPGASDAVVWAAVRYRGLDTPSRGCQNECTNMAELPADYQCQNLPSGTDCVGSPEDFGELFCDCDDGRVCECLRGEQRDCGPASDLGICEYGNQICEENYTWSDCDGGISPGVEVCDSAPSQDEDCDGDTNEGCECTPGEPSQAPCWDPSFSCGEGEYHCCAAVNSSLGCAATGRLSTMCMKPYTTTPSDSIATDRRIMYYPDRDGDGYGQDNAASYGTVPQCPKQGTGPGTSVTAQPPAGYVTNHTDCCDATSSAFPGAGSYHTGRMPNETTRGSACFNASTMGYDWDCNGVAELRTIPAWPGCGYGIPNGCGTPTDVEGTMTPITPAPLGCGMAYTEAYYCHQTGPTSCGYSTRTAYEACR
ncbi:MAG: hypothetical protein JW751_23215 [Polyangiaceae bacterium]|nr:hypothetical protein [Polyangiaceae bacterium]